MTALCQAGLPLARPPGTAYQYSNVGQSLLGRAIEAVTGTPVEQVIQDRLLIPLGLDNTRFAAADYPGGSDLAWGFRTFDDGVSFTREPYVGSGALADRLSARLPDL